jgi:Na+/proline symporter
MVHAVGRVVTAVMTCLGILWIPVVHSSSSGLYVYTHKVMAYMAPPVTVVFVAGVFWPGANARGAAACFAYGLVVGQARLVLELLVPRSPANSFLVTSFCHSNFLHFAAGFGASCAAVLVGVSRSSEHVRDGEGAKERAGRRAGSASPGPSVVELHEITTAEGEANHGGARAGEGGTGVSREEARTQGNLALLMVEACI